MVVEAGMVMISGTYTIFSESVPPRCFVWAFPRIGGHIGLLDTIVKAA